MREYAQIVNDIVKNVAVFEDEPMFEPAEGFFIEVTKTIPRPGIGWTYLGGDRFEPPEYKPPENIEKPIDKAKEIFHTVDINELDRTDLGKAIKAIATTLELI